MIRKIKSLLLLSLFPLAALAQNTVYFGNISKKTSVGLGINGNSVTLSVMELNKSKKFDEFELLLYDMDGNPIDVSLKEDTIYHLEIDKQYAHQKDFALTIQEYTKLKQSLGSQSYAIIDGQMYNGAALGGVLRTLEVEQNLFLKGRMPNIKNVSLWNWNRGIEMMRFKHPDVKSFRYIRNRIPRQQ